MNEPYPGEPGGGYRPHPGRRPANQVDQPNNWPNNDWFGREHGPDPRDASGEHGRGRHQRNGDGFRVQRRHHGSRLRPESAQTTVDQIRADQVLAAPTAALASREREANLSPAQASLNWARNRRNWALIAGVLFFLVDTFLMVDGFTRPVAMASRMLVVFIWLVSLVAVGLLWLRGSSRFAIQSPLVRTETGSHQR